MRSSILLLAALTAAPAHAQESYRVPPKVIADLVDAPQTPLAWVGPDEHTLVLAELPGLPGIGEVAEPELRLAGQRVNPRTNGPSRRQFVSKLSFMDLAAATPQAREVRGVPAGAKIADVAFSPDGKQLAFTVTGDSAVQPWVADVATATARRVADVRLNGALGKPCAWRPDGAALICRVVPDGRGAEPAADSVPRGPIVLENAGQKKPARTNPDLLRSAHDEALFEHYVTAQLVRLGLDGAVAPIGKPGLVAEHDPSPDGKLLLVRLVHRPFSTRVEWQRFPHRVEVWDAAGKVVKLLVDNPLKDEVPTEFSAVPTGPRDVEWRGDADATLCWAEARDGGDPKVKAAIRDELLCLRAPFTGRPTRLAALEYRHAMTAWGDGGLALVTERWWDNRKTRTTIVAPDDPRAAPRVLWDRSFEDRYTDPGSPMLRPNARGALVLRRTAEGALLLAGAGASPEGDRPFLDQLALGGARPATTRLWRSEAPSYEQVIDIAGTRVVTRREAVTEPPQYYLRGLASLADAPRKLTSFPHPTPALAKVQKRLLKYRRADGVALTAMLYLPPGYDARRDGRLPTLLWAYPREFKSADAAGQVQDSPYRFARAAWGGPMFALTMGFAVVENPTFPIVGEGAAEPNDSYREQLVAGARAAIDEVVRLGVADRGRVAIGGHSYGAFTVANLLAHSDLFRAGIARSGAYNRTLTPFGFQAEQRTFWQAPQVYVEMSPFTHAQKIDEPILLIHGQADNNTGTFPIQTERLFEALQGLGATARMVMLPAESHGYKARESALHVLWEQQAWLEKYVKNARPRGATARKD